MPPKYLEVFCNFCPWRETYHFESDLQPEKHARELLREHIATTHDAITLKAYDDHVARYGLTDPSNWDRATRDEVN